jgi:hypothetical protein
MFTEEVVIRSSLQVTGKEAITPGTVLRLHLSYNECQTVVVVPKPDEPTWREGLSTFRSEKIFLCISLGELMSGIDPKVGHHHYPDAGIVPYKNGWHDHHWVERLGSVPRFPSQVIYCADGARWRMQNPLTSAASRDLQIWRSVAKLPRKMKKALDKPVENRTRREKLRLDRAYLRTPAARTPSVLLLP